MVTVWVFLQVWDNDSRPTTHTVIYYTCNFIELETAAGAGSNQCVIRYMQRELNNFFCIFLVAVIHRLASSPPPPSMPPVDYLLTITWNSQSFQDLSLKCQFSLTFQAWKKAPQFYHFPNFFRDCLNPVFWNTSLHHLHLSVIQMSVIISPSENPFKN